MTNPTELAERRPPTAAVAQRGRCGWRGALSSFAVLALSGCGLSTDGAGALFVDPGRYTLYHCDDLAARRKVLQARENELRGLIERAGESPGGAVIGSFAYRSDYDSVLAEEKLLQRNAAEKNCSFASPLQSDQTIANEPITAPPGLSPARSTSPRNSFSRAWSTLRRAARSSQW